MCDITGNDHYRTKKTLDLKKYLSDLRALQTAVRLTSSLYNFTHHIAQAEEDRATYQSLVDQVCALHNPELHRLQEISFRARSITLTSQEAIIYDEKLQPKVFQNQILPDIDIMSIVLLNPEEQTAAMLRIQFPSTDGKTRTRAYIPVDAIEEIMIETER